MFWTFFISLLLIIETSSLIDDNGENKPIIEALHAKVTVTSGQKAILTCTFSGTNHDLSLSSSHQLIWIRQSYASNNADSILAHNQDLLISDYRLNIQRTDIDYSLTITNVNIDDEGIYSCEVNTQPPQKAFVHLYVQVMRRSDSDESLAYQSRADDRFFVITTVILPFCAQGAYLFDVFYYHLRDASSNGYEGLLSSILSVFVYLQYCVPLRSIHLRFLYHLSLWILSLVGTLGHVILYAKKNDVFHVVIYAIWAAMDSIYSVALIYCRVFSKRHGLRVYMAMKQEHLFHFISRLEVILAIFIPVFFDGHLITLTKDNIAFYILFDFFAESYHRFRGVTIKATLYIFVITVTASVTTEWLHIAKHETKFEVASLILELIAGGICYSLIIMQFFPGNFASKKKRNRKATGVSTTSTVATEKMSDNCTEDTNSYKNNSVKRISYF